MIKRCKGSKLYAACFMPNNNYYWLIYHLSFVCCLMLKNILKKSMTDMSGDSKIIRLTFLTSFFHSLIVVLLLILNVNDILAKNYENWLYIGKVAEYFIQQIGKNHVIGVVIVITVLLFVSYSIIYPIWQSAIIHYLHEKKWIKIAMRKWREDFFPMFEFGAFSMASSSIIFFLVIIRILVLRPEISNFVVFLLILWLITFNVINLLKVYTRYFIAVDGLPVYESLKLSFGLTLSNVKNSFRFMRVQTILLINFSVNLIVLAWIPFLLIYAAIKLNIDQYPIVKIFIYLIFFLLVLWSAYVSSIIRAFFAYFWYEIYKKLKNK